MDQQIAYEHGEGDRSLRWWKRAMWSYYSQVCEEIGRKPSSDMPLICQRFRLVYK
ncbi:MAG: ASCH domain-containing protein [Anaerolineae bacterium]|nr:ASCH domain-containing protein [Anaerolineae bacterium]